MAAHFEEPHAVLQLQDGQQNTRVFIVQDRLLADHFIQLSFSRTDRYRAIRKLGRSGGRQLDLIAEDIDEIDFFIRGNLAQRNNRNIGRFTIRSFYRESSQPHLIAFSLFPASRQLPMDFRLSPGFSLGQRRLFLRHGVNANVVAATA